MSISFTVAQLPPLAQHHAQHPHYVMGELWISGKQARLYDPNDSQLWVAIADPFALEQIKSHLPDSNEYLGGAGLFTRLKLSPTGIVLYNLYSITLSDILNTPASAWPAEIALRPIPGSNMG